jgi:hypothetical protein
MSNTSPAPPPARTAYYGRTAAAQPAAHVNDHLTSQYLACVEALPDDAQIVAVYYDIGPAAGPDPHPPDHLSIATTVLRRDGGLAQLLTDAAQHRFDYLVATAPDRLSRNWQQAVQLLRQLTTLDVTALFVSTMDADFHRCATRSSR